LSLLTSEKEKVDRLCELNVINQVETVCHTTIVQDAWARGKSLTVHGWIYGIKDGLLKDLKVSINQEEQIDEVYRLNR
jgi:carbonic anhydrase